MQKDTTTIPKLKIRAISLWQAFKYKHRQRIQLNRIQFIVLLMVCETKEIIKKSHLKGVIILAYSLNWQTELALVLSCDLSVEHWKIEALEVIKFKGCFYCLPREQCLGQKKLPAYKRKVLARNDLQALIKPAEEKHGTNMGELSNIFNSDRTF